MFYYGIKTSDLDNKVHILKHLHGRMVFGPFEFFPHEGTLWSGYRAVIYFILIKKNFLHFFRHGYHFYDRYLNSVDKKSILMMMVLVRNQNWNFKEDC